ncbi:MAG TPA: hypothetical protein VH025_05620 [Solirubrobacteraceae bacterium]|jgi:hypothetical protein|nr:hypothetical protein [Solirubrobacteraceae bacterium]
MRHGKEAKQVQGTRHLRSRKALAMLATAGAMVLVSFSAAASAAPPATPFAQCPSVGFDSSCAELIVINEQGGVELFADPSQGSFAGLNASLIGVENRSATPVSSVDLKGQDIFGFVGFGVCSGNDESDEPGPGFTTPVGCAFGPTGYEGPDNTFSGYEEEDPEQDANTGTVDFTTALAPGASTYLSLEGVPFVACGETACEPTSVSTSLTAGTETGPTMEVPLGTAVSENASVGGNNGTVADGLASYTVYSDSSCTSVVQETEEEPVAGGIATGSEAVTLPEGTYYWRASYSGDDHNGASQSICGAVVEKVVSPICKTAGGKSLVGAKKAKQTLTDRLTTTITKKKPRLLFKSSTGTIKLTHATSMSCTVGINRRTFSVTGDAQLKKKGSGVETGYHVAADIAVTSAGATHLTLTLEKGATVTMSITDLIFSTSTQTIS